MEKVYTGDPSEIIQSFPNFNLQMHCCRYWWIINWEHRKLSFPFWRIYNNVQRGGFMEYKQQVYEMEPDTLYLIAPNTDYSSRLYSHPIPEDGYRLTGGRISETAGDKLGELLEKGAIEHLFIHFTLGYPYDSVSPGIYPFRMNRHLEDRIIRLRNYLTEHVAQFNFTIFLTIQSLICELLFSMGEEKWKYPIRDVRIARIINLIENNIGNDFTNESLANRANMATNAFSRLFREHVGETLQNFIRKKRIQHACLLLLHSNRSIDEIADKTGFANRYHFSRIFSRITGYAPAKYRKESAVLGITPPAEIPAI
ncbi:MAG: helix-turn-helix domain-containing protein [Tannerella sp.]|jgi:AraC-like DNA-binding protein|nr:helix-turn-helix domain-containing protein [Tannerella sp.]